MGMTGSGAAAKKVVIVGIDGVSPEVLDRMIVAGKLPNFRRLKERGSFGSLRSTILPITPAAWSASYTGKNPGKTGLYGFHRKKKGSYDWDYVNSREIGAKTLWEIASERGLRSILIGCPVTMPRGDFNGILIGGFPDYHPEDGIYPASLKKTAIEDLGFEVCHYNTQDFAEFERSIQKRFENARFFLKNHQWDIFMVGFEQLEIAHHNLMLLNPKVAALYEVFDRHLGIFIDAMPQECTCLLYSDHGTAFYQKMFHLPSWLVKEGFLLLKSGDVRARIAAEREREEMASIADPYQSLFMKRITVAFYYMSRFVKKRFWFIKKIFPFLKLPNTMRPSVYTFKESIYDYPGSKAYFYQGVIGNYGGIYINVKKREADGIVDPGRNYEMLRDEIIKRLEEHPAVRRAWKKEQLYSGSFMDEIYDIVVELTDAYAIDVSDTVNPAAIVRPFNYSQHQIDGFLMASGSEIARGVIIKTDIKNVMPSVLYLAGLPVPSDIDGNVIEELVKPSALRERPVARYEADTSIPLRKVACTDEERDLVESRLKSLGYM